jgi:hypothetical protein|tara:strand:+ start:1128 stop:1694 length:567 start_codon:yes stop_codon:yes gene_type:complete
MNIDIHRTSIYVTQYKSKKHVDIFLDHLNKCKRSNKLSTVSNVGGIQTENINSLKIQDCWKEPLNAYILQFKKVKDFKIKIYSCWINQNFTFDYNMPHNHTGSLIQFSGIWYIKAPKNCGDLLFLNKSENSDPTNLFKYIDDPLSWIDYRITPEDNRLILFPSTLVHLVEPNRSSQDRISVAFNVSLI